MFPTIRGNKIAFYNDGHAVTMEVEKSMQMMFELEANRVKANTFDRAWQMANKMFVAGTTGILRPAFAVSNVAIDTVSAFAQTRYKGSPISKGLEVLAHVYKAKAYDAVHGTKTINKYTEVYDKYMLMGGNRITRLSMQDATPEDIYQSIFKEETLATKAFNVAAKGIDIWSAPVQGSEVVNRLGEFAKSIEAGNPDIVAFEEAVRVTAPFAHEPLGLEFM